MSDEKFLLVGLHKLAQQNGDGLVPELLERLQATDTSLQHSAEIVMLPGLHQRVQKAISSRSPRSDATIISFPAPKWQRNAGRRSG
ncbi:hypothetical protein M8R20_09505 [Pseudomonas sp. R2.Fl]|nr:hypothetical protein [Pseudomonas sp. R2.Fl]